MATKSIFDFLKQGKTLEINLGDIIWYVEYAYLDDSFQLIEYHKGTGKGCIFTKPEPITIKELAHFIKWAKLYGYSI